METRIKIGQWEGKQQEPVVDHPPILNPRIIHIALCSGCILDCAKGDYEEARERVTCVWDGRGCRCRCRLRQDCGQKNTKLATTVQLTPADVTITQI